MNNKTYTLNTVLAAVVGVALAIAVLVRTFLPLVIMPVLSIPNLVGISLIALVLEHYLVRCESRCYLCVAFFSFLAFWLLSWAAAFTGGQQALLVGVKGAVVFTVTTFLFSSAQDRISTGPSAKAAPVAAAAGLYLASQCLMGIFR